MSTSALVSVAKAVLGMEKANKIVINGTMYSISLFSGIYLTYGATATGNDGEIIINIANSICCILSIVDYFTNLKCWR